MDGTVHGLLRISDAAREVGVSPSALRLWERQGLLAARRPDGRERRYGPAEIERLRRIRRLRVVEGLNAAGIRRVLGEGRELADAGAIVPGAIVPGAIVPGAVVPSRAPGGPGGAAAATGSEPAPGLRLRELRRRAGLSLRDVAARADLSASFVSSLERGTTGASVAALVRLAGALDTTASALLGDAPGAATARTAPDRVVRDGRRRATEAGLGVRIEELADHATQLQPQLFVLAPGASSHGAYAHVGEEFMYVLAGRVAVWLDERERHELGPGDALTFPSSLPHRFVALGRDESRILWVNTPPTF